MEISEMTVREYLEHVCKTLYISTEGTESEMYRRIEENIPEEHFQGFRAVLDERMENDGVECLN